MKAKKRDLMLHAVLLIYFEFIVILYQQEKYLLLGKLEFCVVMTDHSHLKRKNL